MYCQDWLVDAKHPWTWRQHGFRCQQIFDAVPESVTEERWVGIAGEWRV